MIRKLLIAASFLFLALNNEELCAKESTTYKDLIEQAKNFDKSVDFLKLRLLYAQSSDYQPLNTFDAEREAMFEAFDDNQFQEALKTALAILEQNYLVLDAHYVCALAYQKMNDPQKHDLHIFILTGLVKSILDHGDGISPETAYKVINVEEEYFLIYSMGFVPLNQKTLRIAGHNYDEIAIQDAQGNKGSMYFNVDLLFDYYNKLTEKAAQKQ